MSHPVDPPERAPRVHHDELGLRDVGRCIYCGSAEGLSDEHVIPFGLAGKHILRNASCAACARTTSQWEGLVLTAMMGPFRAALELPTRRPKKRPTDVPVRVRRGSSWSDERMPIAALGTVAPFPILPPPGIYEDRPTSDGFKTLGFVAIRVFLNSEDQPANVARRAGANEVLMEVPLHPGAFMRMLAKIAWGFTVDRFGLDAIEPSILGLILGTDDDLGRWVGFPATGKSAFAGPPDVTFRATVYASEAGDVIAAIQLFGPHGGPEYQVVVGTFR